MHQQHLVKQALYWGAISVCHCRGCRRARDLATDWVLSVLCMEVGLSSLYKTTQTLSEQLQAQMIVTGTLIAEAGSLPIRRE